MNAASPSSAPEPEPTEEELLQRCLDHSEADQLEELEQLCLRFPPRAAGLRRRYAMLASHGLVSLPLAPGHRWGAYRLLEELGRGGMGVVYLAEHVEWKRRVALKFLSPELASSERAAERFRREIAALTKLDHPGLCTVFEAGEHHGQPFVAMRHVPGRTLAAVFAEARAEARTPDAATVLAWFEQIARAVDCAHQAGIVHRDLKPANVMLQDDGRPVVLDFGLARDSASGDVTLTASQDAIGTPAYMAPEQVTGAAVGPWTDVHALGAMLHEALTLSAAFPGMSRTDVFHRVQHEAPTRLRVLRPDLGRDLELVLASCLDKEPHRRYARAGALADDLRALQERRPIAVRPLPMWLRAWRWAQRNRVAASMLASLTALAGVATWFAIAQASADRAMRGRNLVLAGDTATVDDPELAALFAEATYRLQPSPESLDFLRSSLFEVHEEMRVRQPGQPWSMLELVGDQHVLVGGNEPWCELLHFDGTGPAVRLSLPGRPRVAAVGPDGTIAIATAKHVRLFDPQGNELPWRRDGLVAVCSLHWVDAERLVASRQCGATMFFRDDAPDAVCNVPDATGKNQVVGAMSRDRSTLVLGTKDQAYIVPIVARGFGMPQPLHDTLFAGAGTLFALAVDANGQQVLAATSNYLGASRFHVTEKRDVVTWWRRGDGEWRVREIVGYPGEVFGVGVSPDGHRFAFATNLGDVWVHAADDGRLLFTCQVDDAAPVTDLVWSADNQRLVAVTTNRRCYVFGERGQRVATLHCDGGYGVRFEADGRHLWTVGRSLQRHALVRPENLIDQGGALYFATPGEHGVVATCGRHARIRMNRDGAPWRNLHDAALAAKWFCHCAVLRDGGLVAAGFDGSIVTFDRDGRVAKARQLGAGALTRVLPLPDGRFLAVCNVAPGAFRVAADLQSAEPLPGAIPAWGADVTPDGRWFTLADKEGARVLLWDLGADPPAVRWQHAVDAPDKNGIAIADDGQRIVFGKSNGVVVVFDLVVRADTGDVHLLGTHTWSAHDGEILDVDVAADGRIATASSDRTAAVWTPAGKLLAHLLGHRLAVWSARFVDGGRRVLTASEDATARLWPLDAEDVLELARRDVHPESRRSELAARADLVGDLLDRR